MAETASFLMRMKFCQRWFPMAFLIVPRLNFNGVKERGTLTDTMWMVSAPASLKVSVTRKAPSLV